jgi:hypothetical protein
MPPIRRTSTHLTIGETSKSITTEPDSDSSDPFQNFYDPPAELVAKRRAEIVAIKAGKGPNQNALSKYWRWGKKNELGRWVCNVDPDTCHKSFVITTGTRNVKNHLVVKHGIPVDDMPSDYQQRTLPMS